MATLRIFICVELPERIRAQIAELQGQLKPLGSGVSWTRAQGIHLTLKFLGDVESDQINAIAEAVEQASLGGGPFPVTVSGTGGFPNLIRPRVLWVGIMERSGRLGHIQSQIDRELAKLGYPREQRRFLPHLTVGRVKAPNSVKEICMEMQRRGFEPMTFSVHGIIVMRSDLKPDGAIYTPLKTIEL